MRRALLTILMLAPGAAIAASPSSGEQPIQPPVPVLGSTWADGQNRLFIATAIDAGFLYLRPRASLGYGRPHYMWFGADVNPILSQNGLGAYGGLRLQVPYFDVRVGGRMFLPLLRSFLVERESYSRLDLEDRTGPSSRYLTLETEVTASFPIGPGALFFVGSLSSVQLIPEGYYVFEETIRVILKPPWVWRTRIGYAFKLGPQNSITFTPVFEYVRMPGRGEEVLRAGIVASHRLSDDLEAQATFVPIIASPDRIGLDGADFAQLGIRWRWATGL